MLSAVTACRERGKRRMLYLTLGVQILGRGERGEEHARAHVHTRPTNEPVSTLCTSGGAQRDDVAARCGCEGRPEEWGTTTTWDRRSLLRVDVLSRACRTPRIVGPGCGDSIQSFVDSGTLDKRKVLGVSRQTLTSSSCAFAAGVGGR